MYNSARSDEGTKEVLHLTRMTKKGIQALCKKNKLYQTPELNDVLYLHYQGYRDIECLEEYTGLKCLWLENNAISEIVGLDNQKILKCLFLNNNLIRKIENLENCPELDTLNLSNNQINRIENCGVDKLPVLTTLILSHNCIRTAEQLEDVINCRMLSVLELAHNQIEDILIVKIFAQMPELRVLDLDGNPVVSKIPQYRKTLILECKNLTHLDRRPVFPRDRACAEAWRRGGYEEERREHNRWNKAERRKMRESVNATIRLRNRGGGDFQVDLIPSSDDEDDTERSSAPSTRPPPKQQPADSLSIDENVQYVEYYNSEAISQVEKQRETQKCKIYGRVECKYVHIEEHPIAQKLLESPEDILEKSQGLFERQQMGNPELPNDFRESDMDTVNIPDVSKIRHDSEFGSVENSENQDIYISPNREINKEYLELGNRNKDDLFEKTCVNYFDTVDRLLYTESKAAGVSFAQELAYNNEGHNVGVIFVDNDTSKTTSKQQENTESLSVSEQQHQLINEVLEECLSSSLSKVPNSDNICIQETPQINGSELHDHQNKDNKQTSELEESKFVFDSYELKTKDTLVPKSNLNKIGDSRLAPLSEKKKVRLIIELETDENHVKIPTTPIPRRKGRKINWDRAHDKNKRTKLDRGKSVEDMLDIYADWFVNPNKCEQQQDVNPIGVVGVSTKPNILSSTFNESALDIISFCAGDFEPAKFDKDAFLELSVADISAAHTLNEVSNDSIENAKSSSEHNLSKCSVEDPLDNSTSHIETTEAAISSIRRFISSYDIFLQSIESRAQELSERCKLTCVPPEYLNAETQEENKDFSKSQSQDGVEVNYFDAKTNELSDQKLLKEETLAGSFLEHLPAKMKLSSVVEDLDIKESQLDEIESTLNTVFSDCLSSATNPQIKENLESLFDFGDGSKNELHISPSYVNNEVRNGAMVSNFGIMQTGNQNLDLITDRSNLNPSSSDKDVLSSAPNLQGYHTSEGRRNSQIIQRLLGNLLTKKQSAEATCEDLHDITEFSSSLDIIKQTQIERNAKVVEVAYPQKDTHESILEIIGNNYPIHNTCSNCKRIIEEVTSSRDVEQVEQLTLKTRTTDGATLETTYKCDILGGPVDELAEDLRNLFKLEDEESLSNNKTDSEGGIYEDPHQCKTSSIKPRESFKDFFGVGECFDDMIGCFSEKHNEDSPNGKDFFQNLSRSIQDCVDAQTKTTSKNTLIQIESASTSFVFKERLSETERPEACQIDDSSETYHETVSSYVISETNDGPEIFQPTQSDDDENAVNTISYSMFSENDVQTIMFDSLSSCDAMLGTTSERTIASSCWEEKDKKDSSCSILSSDFQNNQSESESGCDQKLHRDQQLENHSTVSCPSDTEENESRSITACPSARFERYTV